MIIYNDETEHTKDFVNWYKKNYSKAVKRTPRQYLLGAYRLEVSDLRITLNKMMDEQKTNFVITDKVIHRHSIGNNNLFEVRYKINREQVECIICKIALNSDMFGNILHQVEDLSGNVLCK